tara:strand:+ start:5669 stop:5938 length:270 start_codon:yes stop_codon:yes gene_type:complete
MPIYNYLCKDCDEVFSLQHLMFETINNCDICEGENIVRVINPVRINKKTPTKRKVGSVVKEFIKDAKEDLKTQKKELTKKDKELNKEIG